MKIRSKVQAGGVNLNHVQGGLVVRSRVRAGGVKLNHNQTR